MANCDKHTLWHKHWEANVEIQWIYCMCLNSLESHFMDMKCKNTQTLHKRDHYYIGANIFVHTETCTHTHTHMRNYHMPTHHMNWVFTLFTDATSLKSAKQGKISVCVQWNQTSVEENSTVKRKLSLFCFVFIFTADYKLLYCIFLVCCDVLPLRGINLVFVSSLELSWVSLICL